MYTIITKLRVVLFYVGVIRGAPISSEHQYHIELKSIHHKDPNDPKYSNA